MNNFLFDCVDDEVTERLLVKLIAGSLALPVPVIAVEVKDAEAEEVLKKRDGMIAFGAVGEVGLEDVLNVCSIGGNESIGVEGEVEDYGMGGGLGEEGGDPFKGVMTMLEEMRDVT